MPVLQFFRHAQRSALATRIARRFFGRGSEFAEKFYGGRMVTDANGQRLVAYTVHRQHFECLFYDPIFQRMKGYHRYAAARFEHARQIAYRLS